MPKYTKIPLELEIEAFEFTQEMLDEIRAKDPRNAPPDNSLFLKYMMVPCQIPGYPEVKAAYQYHQNRLYFFLDDRMNHAKAVDVGDMIVEVSECRVGWGRWVPVPLVIFKQLYHPSQEGNSPKLPERVVSCLKQVSNVFGNFPDKSLGKEIAQEAKQILEQYNQ